MGAARKQATRREQAGTAGSGRFLVAAALLACAVVLAADRLLAAERTETSVPVMIETLAVEPLSQTVPVIGRLVPLQAGPVAARVDGAIDKLTVQVGDRVEAGMVLAVLDADRMHAERQLRAAAVAEAEAALGSARAERALREQELARLEALRRSPAFSEARVDDKRQEVIMAAAKVAEGEAAVARAQAQLRLADIALRDSQIRAPYPGVVVRRRAEIGSRLSVGEAIVDLVDDRELEIDADVPADRLGGLAPGTRVEFLHGGSTHRALVRAVVPDENPLTRTRTVRFVPEAGSISDPAANVSVTVLVPAGAARAVLSVHKDAVIYRSDGPHVVRVVEGRADVRPVKLGEAIGPRFEVLDGLAEGDQVVVRGNERLQPGQAVAVRSGSRG